MPMFCEQRGDQAVGFLPTRKTALVSANIGNVGNIRGATVLAAQFPSHGRGVNFVNFGHSDTARALRLR